MLRKRKILTKRGSQSRKLVSAAVYAEAAAKCSPGFAAALRVVTRYSGVHNVVLYDEQIRGTMLKLNEISMKGSESTHTPPSPCDDMYVIFMLGGTTETLLA